MKKEIIYIGIGTAVIVGLFSMIIGVVIGKKQQKGIYRKSAVEVLSEAKEIGTKTDLQMKRTAEYLNLVRKHIDSVTVKETVYIKK